MLPVAVQMHATLTGRLSIFIGEGGGKNVDSIFNPAIQLLRSVS